MKAVQTPNAAGGMGRTYTTLSTIWAEIKSLKGIREYVEKIRGESVTDIPTHEVTVRDVAINTMGRGFSSAFSSAFDSVADLAPIKSDNYIFLQRGSTAKGRLFQVTDFKHDEERREWFKFRVMEVEERGTGWPE